LRQISTSPSVDALEELQDDDAKGGPLVVKLRVPSPLSASGSTAFSGPVAASNATSGGPPTRGVATLEDPSPPADPKCKKNPLKLGQSQPEIKRNARQRKLKSCGSLHSAASTADFSCEVIIHA
jgi:hypothetical protein